MKRKHLYGGLYSPLAIAIVSLLSSHATRAASAAWNGTTDSLWSTTTNWSASPVPGTTDTATFDNAGNGNVVIDLESGVTTKSLVFDTANVAAFTIGSVGQTLTLEAAGSVLVNPDAANNQLFNANLALATASGAADFTLTNNSATNSLTFAGAISGVGTGDTKTLTVAGVGTTAISGNISNGVGTVALKKDGAGTLNLSGTHTYTGDTTVRQGALNITGGSITSAGGFFGAIDASKPMTTLSGNAALTFTNSGAQVRVGALNNGNPSSLVMTGSSTLTTAGNFSVGGWPGGTNGSGEFAMKDDAVLTVQSTASLGFYVQGDGSSGTSHMLLRDNAIVNACRMTLSSNFGTLTQTGGEVNIDNNGAAGGTLNRLANGAGRQAWYNMTGGSFNVAGTVASTLAVGVNRGFGHMNITGTAEVNLANAVDFRLCSDQNNNGNRGFFGEVNLKGGTFSVPKVTSMVGGDILGGVFNFNGGILKATKDEPAFMQDLKATNNTTPGAAYVYPGGAVIDTNTFNITIAQPLLEPVGNGVTSISFNPGTKTYVAPPRIDIASPPGSLPARAQCFATLDDNGQINGIILTKPGFGYTTESTSMTFDMGDATAICTFGPVTGGGLTKKSTGNLTLSGVNTYTGDTFIQQGGLTLASTGGLKFKIGANGVNNQITGTGSVQLDGAFLIDLTGASAVAGNSWTLVDAATLTENFGATFTVTGWTENGSDWTLPDGETGNLWKFSESTGVLTYQSASTPYQTWADGYPGTDLSDPAADADGDGVSNFEEFAFGLNPTDGASANPIVDSSDLANGVFTYTRLVDSGLTYTVWTSEDLKTWTVPENVSESPGAAVDGVQPVTVEISPLPSGSKYFVRVSAQ